VKARLRRVDWDRLMGIVSLVCAVLIVASWWINPATIP
jgi:hypothetical protein